MTTDGPGPLVSVLIITYNQQDFIDQAIQSVVDQDTDFPFDVIVSDDCSTDRTWDACLSAQARFPDRVTIVRPERNLGINGNLRFVLGHATGEYIAICEGDDFWIDRGKLQRQVDALNARPEVDLAITRGDVVYGNGERGSELWDHGPTARILTPHELFAGYGWLAPTASLLWRKAATARLPDWFDQLGFSDQIIIIAASRRGGVFYDPTVTVAYRAGLPNSFTRVLGKLSIEAKIKSSRQAIVAIEDSVQFFDFPRSAIAHRIDDWRIRLIGFLLRNGDRRAAAAELWKLPAKLMIKTVLRRLHTRFR